MESKGLCFVAYNRPSNKYSLNVIAGALESALTPQDVEIRFASKPESLTSAIDEASRLYRNTVVGWSLHSPQFVESSAELHTLKSRTKNSEVIHLAGGPHPTAEPEQTLRAGFDAVAVGEGEKTIIEFSKRLLNGENCFHINGIAYLSDGRFVSNGSGERIELNDYPPFAPRHRRLNPIEITRGCIYACRFCQTPFMFKARFRHRAVENICHWVQVMKNRGLTDIRFITPTALSYGSSDTSVNLDKVEELLYSVRTVLGSKGRIFFGTFPSEIRPEHVSREALLILKKYTDNDNLIIGAQSGSQRVLDMSHRGHTIKDIVMAVRLSLEVGFIPNVDFIFGLPGEEDSDSRASLRLMEELSDIGARIHGHTFMPLPGTPFKNAAPGVIRPATMRKLRRLVARGKLYGDWEEQAVIAQRLKEPEKREKEHYEIQKIQVY